MPSQVLPFALRRDFLRLSVRASRGGPTAAAVADLCHAVLNLNEFLYAD